jgi:hypothetical protein
VGAALTVTDPLLKGGVLRHESIQEIEVERSTDQ